MDDAIEVLRAAMLRAKDGVQTGPDVRLALRVLRFMGIPNEVIRFFWESCATEHEIGRSQNMSAAFNRIVLYREGKI